MEGMEGDEGGEEEGRWKAGKARKATKEGGMEEMEGVAGPCPCALSLIWGKLQHRTGKSAEATEGYGGRLLYAIDCLRWAARAS